MSTPFFSNLHRFIEKHVPDKINVDQLHGMTSRFSPEEKQWTGFNEFTKPLPDSHTPETTEWTDTSGKSLKWVPGTGNNDYYHIEHPVFKDSPYKAYLRPDRKNPILLGEHSTLEGAKQLVADHEKSNGLGGVNGKIDKSALLAYMAKKTPQYQHHVLGAPVKNELVWFHGKDHSSADSQGGSKFVINYLPDGNPKDRPWDLSHLKAPYYHRDPEPSSFATREEAIAAAQSLHNYTKGRTSPTKHKTYTLPGGTNYNEHIFEWLNNPGSTYKKGVHWDQNNPMFHLRTKDRGLIGGGKALHLEELQSDLHQDGRKRGYDTPAGREEVEQFADRKAQLLRQANDEVGPIEDQISTHLRNVSRLKSSGQSNTLSPEDRLIDHEFNGPHLSHYTGRYKFKPFGHPVLDPLINQANEIRRKYNEQYLEMGPEKSLRRLITNAPHKGDWKELAFRTALYQAAKAGKSHLTWSTGEQSAQHYNLEKHVGRIRYENGMLRAWSSENPEGKPIGEKGVALHDLDTYLGKELADKLLQSHNGEMTPEGEKVYELQGHGMKVGANGMKGFYGSHNPTTGEVEHGVMSRIANAYAKKLHGAGAPQAQVYQTTGKNGHHVFGIEITPQMRERILREGVPLWGHTDTSMIKALVEDFDEEDLIKGRRIIIHHGKGVEAGEINPTRQRHSKPQWGDLGMGGTPPVQPTQYRTPTGVVGGFRSTRLALPFRESRLRVTGGRYDQGGIINPVASNTSTIGKSRDDSFVKLLGNSWNGSTIHHISSNVKPSPGKNVVPTQEQVHLVHTLDPKAAAHELVAHVGEGAGARVVPHTDGVNHSVTMIREGVPHRVLFFRGLTQTPTTRGKVMLKANPGRAIVVVPATPDTSQDLLKALIDEQFNSPLYEELNGGSFGTGVGSAWLHPDGSHEKVRTHASSLAGTGMTMSDYQRKTGKVRVGLDRRGAYVGVVGHVTPEQHRVANEFLRAAMFRDKTPSWERTDPDRPGHFEYKETTLPARLVKKALGEDEFDVIKAKKAAKPKDPNAWKVPDQYKLPAKMEENSPEHGEHIRGTSYGENDPHPEMRSQPFEYKSVTDAYNAIPGLREKFGYAPQNLWHSDQALMDMLRKGELGKNWYQQYHDGLTELAKRSDISPRRLLSVFALNGQAAGLTENAQATLKEFSRHRAGLYDDPNEAQLMKELGIMKAPSGTPAELSTTLDLMGGGDISTKKLKAYAKSFHDLNSNPAIDMWVQRAMVGGGHRANQPDSVSPHVTKAATGRINYLRDLWNKQNPHDPVSSSQVQAMLWYGMKHSAADHLDRIADHIEAHHPEYKTGQLRETSRKIRYDGSFDQTGHALGLADERGLPLSATHVIMKSIIPHIKQAYQQGLVHTDHYNWHKVTSTNTPEELADAIKYLQSHHSSYKNVRVQSDGKNVLISPPKRGRDGVATLLAHKGVTFDPVKFKDGATKTEIQPGFANHLLENPELRHQLATLHATIQHHEDHPHKTLIGDIGHGTENLAKEAYKSYPKGEAPEPIHQPIIYGAFRNHPAYNEPLS